MNGRTAKLLRNVERAQDTMKPGELKKLWNKTKRPMRGSVRKMLLTFKGAPAAPFRPEDHVHG